MQLFGVWRASALTLIFPLVFSLAAFALAMVALFAGTGAQQQQLEDYHIIAINMSYFGQDLIPTPTPTEEEDPTNTGDDSWWDQATEAAGDAVDDVKDELTEELNEIANGAVDKLTEVLGISQWYSFHIMAACQGDFAPNFTDPAAWFNTTNCTAREAGVNFNLTEVLDKEIDAGPLDIDLTKVQVPEAVQDAIDMLNAALFAIFIFYVLGSAFSGLSFLFCIAALSARFRERDGHKKTILFNAASAGLAALTLLVGSVMTTVVANQGSRAINEAGEEAHISAITGRKFMIISWVAFGLMAAAFSIWTVSCFFPRKDRWSQGPRRSDAEKGRASTSSDRGLLGFFGRRR